MLSSPQQLFIIQQLQNDGFGQYENQPEYSGRRGINFVNCSILSATGCTYTLQPVLYLLKVTLHLKMSMPELQLTMVQWYSRNLFLLCNVEDIVVFLDLNCLILIIPIYFPVGENTIENNQYLNLTLISILYLIRQSLLGYHCELGIVIFPYRVT